LVIVRVDFSTLTVVVGPDSVNELLLLFGLSNAMSF
jgi:hypothetical protein